MESDLFSLGATVGFCKRQRGSRTLHKTKSPWVAVSTQTPPVPGRHLAGSAADVLLADCPSALLLSTLTNSLWDGVGEQLMQWEVEAFQIPVIF